MRGQELDNIFETVFLVRILDGHPTLLLEPTNLFPENNYAAVQKFRFWNI